MTTVPDLEIDDSELFSDAMQKEAPERGAMPDPDPTQEEPEEQSERQRDENGRFVAKEAEPKETAEQPAAEAPAEDDKAANVPSWRLRELREERDKQLSRASELERMNGALGQRLEALEQALSKINQPQKPAAERVDFFSNPDEAFNQRVGERIDPVAAELKQIRQDMILENSRTLQIAINGVEAVDKATDAVAQAMAANDPEMIGLRARMLNSRDPVSEVLKWHRNRNVVNELSKFNGDVTAYAEHIRSEALKDKSFLAKALETARGSAERSDKARGSPNVKLPTSINRLSGSGSNVAQESDDDMSDAAIARHAFAPGKARR
jgi:hypothetical protein